MPAKAPDMRRAGLTSPKLYTLAAELGISRAAAIGHLELMWDYTKDHAIQGNIGKWPNGAIARAADWLDDPDKFVDAMVKSGFLDPDLTHRLLVHDWHDHADRWVKASLEKQGFGFLTVPHQATLSPTVVATVEPTIVPTSSLASTSLAKPSLDKKNGTAIALPPWLSESEWLAFKANRKKLRSPMTDFAEKLMIAKLERFKAKGIDPIECLHTSIENGWKGVFEPKDGNHGKANRPMSAVERVHAATRKRDAEIDAAAGENGKRTLAQDG